MTSQRRVEVAVVGAGASGLAAATELGRAGVEAIVLERESSVGGSWSQRYDGLRLNTMRSISGVRRAPIPRSAGTWPAREDYLSYLRELPERCKLDVRLAVDVTRIDRTGEEWRLETSAGGIRARFVVVATGYDRQPRIPEWPGRESFLGELIHSSAYRSGSMFSSRDVLIVGCGNSGTEIATQLVHAGARRVRVAMRTPVNIMPRRFLGLPITVFARISELQPDRLVDATTFAMQRVAWGDLSRHGMPRAPYGVATELRTKGLGPVVDGGFVDALKQARIELVPAVERLDGHDVVLAGGDRIGPEVVIAATGFRHGLESLVGHLGVLLATGKPAVLGAKSHPRAPRLYFNGFWLPASGQLPAMRRTSRRIARAIARERRRTG